MKLLRIEGSPYISVQGDLKDTECSTYRYRGQTGEVWGKGEVS